jgi:hypothetical protein
VGGWLVAPGRVRVKLFIDNPHLVLNLRSSVPKRVEVLSKGLMSAVKGLGWESTGMILLGFLNFFEIFKYLCYLFLVS